MKKLAECSTIVDPVCELLGGNFRFDHSKLNFKHPEANSQINWHQDWAFYPHINDDILAVGVLIDDCTYESGPLMAIPGSHKGPIFDHHHDGVFVGGVNTDAIGGLVDKAVKVTEPAGSLTIHHVRTLHASGNSNTNTLRHCCYSAIRRSMPSPFFKLRAAVIRLENPTWRTSA